MSQGGGALLSGHYRGRGSTWNRHGDQKPMNNVKGIFGISASGGGGSKKWSFAPFLMGHTQKKPGK